MSDAINYVLDKIFITASGAIVALIIIIIVLWRLFKVNIPNFDHIQERINMLSYESTVLSDPTLSKNPFLISLLGMFPMDSIITACIVFISIFAGFGILGFILDSQFDKGLYKKIEIISFGGVVVLSLICVILSIFYKASTPTYGRIQREYNMIFSLDIDESNKYIWSGFQFLMVISIISLLGSSGIAIAAYIIKYTLTETVAVEQEIIGGGRRRKYRK